MLPVLDTRRPRLLLTLFCLILWTPGFFTLPPGDRDESRFAQATKQMLETGDFVRIRNGAEARNRKPIGIYWLQAPFAAAARAAGLARANPIWPYRLPSALGGWLAVLGTFQLGAALVGRRAALLGAALLAGSVILSVEVHIAKTDAALLGSVVIAMGVLARAYRAPGTLGAGAAATFWVAMAGSILLKGPVGPMVAGATVLALIAADRRARWLRALRPGWGVPLLLAVVLPWFVAIGVATEGRFFADAVGGDLGRKLQSGDDAHWGPPGLHLLLLPLLLLPAAAVVPAALADAWRTRAEPARRFLLAWIIPSWIVFEAVPTKLPHYTLPLYPALCLLAAGWLLQPSRRPIPRVLASLPVALGGLLAAAVAALPVALGQGWVLGVPGAAASLLFARLFLPLLGSGDAGRLATERRAVFSGLLAMPVLYWAVLQAELPLVRPLWIAPMVAAVRPPGPVGAVGFAEPSLMFLAGTDTRFLSASEAASALRQGELRSVIVADQELSTLLTLSQKVDLQLRAASTLHGYNYSRGRFVTLAVLIPVARK